MELTIDSKPCDLAGEPIAVGGYGRRGTRGRGGRTGRPVAGVHAPRDAP